MIRCKYRITMNVTYEDQIGHIREDEEYICEVYAGHLRLAVLEAERLFAEEAAPVEVIDRYVKEAVLLSREGDTAYIHPKEYKSQK